MESIYTYLNYRDFLRDYYEENKRTNKNFSYRYFSRLAGIKSSGFFKLVITGERGLSPSSTQKFITALKLKKRESNYFENLVLFNESKTQESKKIYFDRLMSIRPSVKFEGIQKDQYEFYTKDYFVIIREMVVLPDFHEDYAWIANHIQPKISAPQAEQAVETLIRLGFLTRDAEGKLCQQDSALATPKQIKSHEALKFQTEMLDKAKDALWKTPKELLEVSSVTIPIQYESIQQVKNLIRKFQEDLATYINKGSNNFSGVFQINMQMFPLTKVNKGNKK